MAPAPPLSDEDAADLALSLSPVERAVMEHFAKGRAWTYSAVAERSNVPIAVVTNLGHKLQRDRLGHVSVIPFNGSRFFLNDRGASVKRAVEILSRIKNERPA